jgi:hypothetical protein
VAEVKRNLASAGIRTNEKKNALSAQVPAQEDSTLARLLEAGAFTTFYGWTDGMELTPTQPTVLLENLGAVQFVAVFTIFDETMEVISKLIPIEAVKKSIQAVCDEAHIEVVW